MPVGPMILKPPPHEQAARAEPILLSAASKGNDIRQRATAILTDAAGIVLLDYVDFVLDQEARYCQQ